MNRMGIVGLDTSHPASFGRVLDQRADTTVAALWDAGTIRDEAYARELASDFGADIYDTPSDMVETVDAVLVTSVNWDEHVSLARPFLEAGIPTLVDKPMVGNITDLEALAALAEHTPLFGGSAVCYHPRLSEFPVGVDDRVLFGAGYNDPFYYGVHMTDTARKLAGVDWTAVTPTDHPGTALDIDFENGSRATLKLDGPSEPGAFGLLDVANETRSTVIGGTAEEHEQMYEAYLDRFVDVVEGRTEETDRVLDAASLLLAVHAAIQSGERVEPSSPEHRGTRIDSTPFVDSYQPYVTS